MPSPSEPPFHTIAIAGLGLIGGSIALAVRERWPSIRIVGVDRPSVLAHALGSGAIERGVATIEEIGAPDLVILAAPVRQNAELLHRLAALGGAHHAARGGESDDSPLTTDGCHRRWRYQAGHRGRGGVAGALRFHSSAAIRSAAPSAAASVSPDRTCLPDGRGF